MIEVTKVRELTLLEPIQTGRPAFLSSASGLVRAGDFFYVVADDDNHLAIFPEEGLEPGAVLRLFEGELPTEKKARKKSKPDLEALTLLPAHLHPPHGALLAIPSGSKPHRCRGAFIPLRANGSVQGPPTAVDMTPVYAFLETQCGPLNIEGAAISGSHFCLLNRGNKKRRTNALVVLDASALLASLHTGALLTAAGTFQMFPVDLGELEGVPLTPTDAAVLDSGHIVFTAAAEATDSSYDDGACHGSAVGIMDLSGKVSTLEILSTPRKLEGIDARQEGNRLVLSLVNDEDSDAAPSELLRTYLPV